VENARQNRAKMASSKDAGGPKHKQTQLDRPDTCG